MRCPAQVATSGWVMPGLVFKWFSLCEFSLFDTPWGYLLLPRASSGKGNGTPLQRSCLENSRDAGAWWAAVYGVSQSQTRLKQLSSSSSKHIEIYILHTHHFYTIQVYGRPLSFRLDKLGKNFLMLISFLTHLSLSIRDSNKKRDPLWV